MQSPAVPRLIMLQHENDSACCCIAARWSACEGVTRFWPAAEPAQLDYERLRGMALAGALTSGGEVEVSVRRLGRLDQKTCLADASLRRHIGGGAMPALVSLPGSMAGGSG